MNTATRLASGLPAEPGPTPKELLESPGALDARTGSPADGIVEGWPADATARRDRRYRRTLALADIVAYAAAMVVCLGMPGAAPHRWALVVGCVGVVLASKACGLYDRDELLVRKTTLDEAPKIFQLATFFVLAFWLADQSLLGQPLGGRVVVALWASLLVFDIVARWCARSYARHTSITERCLVIGDPRSVARIRSRLELHGGATVSHVLTPEQASALVDHGAGTVVELRRLVAQHEIHRIILEPSSDEPQMTLDLVRAAKAAGARVSILPHVLEVVGTAVELDDISGMMLLGVRQFGMSRSSLLLKRGFDVAGAAAGLLCLGGALALIAAAIKLDSPGPVLFRQRRVGRDGREFWIIKFRTMVADAEDRKADLVPFNEADGLFKIADDPRITRVGRLLRRTSLDELPQLLNVLRGEMSLVGPRPLIGDEDAQVAGWYRRRLALTPGMTGQWQIAGSSQIPLSEMVKIDYLYVAGWSLWGDLKILVRTLPYVLGRRGL